MTAKIIFASNKLGEIHDHQLQSMLDELNLGKLISWKRTENGAMGQTLFILTTEGEFVFKGNPLYSGQLVEEKFFIENIEKMSTVSVPTPYMVEDGEDIFGWSYAMMPRLRGEHLNSETLRTKLNFEDKLSIAESIAGTLSSFHRWKVSEFGELNPETLEIIPFENTYTDWLFKRILFWLEDAKKYSEITVRDMGWIQSVLEESEEEFNRFNAPSFVMGDFKTGNFLVHSGKSGWEVSGVFDFTNSYFADPISDLNKMLTYYLDNKEQETAQHLINMYFGERQDKHRIKKRLKVHMLHQRVLDWGSAKATNRLTWDDELSFAEWAESYTDAAANLFE